MLFSMCTGVRLYQRPSPAQKGFRFAFASNIMSYIVKSLKRGLFVTEDILDLLSKIFTPSRKRITMKELLQHPFVRLGGNVNVADSKDDDGNNGMSAHDINSCPCLIFGVFCLCWFMFNFDR